MGQLKPMPKANVGTLTRQFLALKKMIKDMRILFAPCRLSSEMLATLMEVWFFVYNRSVDGVDKLCTLWYTKSQKEIKNK